MRNAWIRFTGWFFFGAAFVYSWMSAAGIFAVPVWMGLLIVLSISAGRLRPNRPGKGIEYAGIPAGLATMLLFIWVLNRDWWGLGLAALILLVAAAALIVRSLRSRLVNPREGL